MTTTTNSVVSQDPPILGANPFVGLSGRQAAAALGRLLQRVVVEPGVITADGLNMAGQLLNVAVGRSLVRPAPDDKRFGDPAWTTNPIYRWLMQGYLVERETLLGLVDQLESGPASFFLCSPKRLPRPTPCSATAVPSPKPSRPEARA